MALTDAPGPIAQRCHARSSRTGKPCQAWAVRGATVCAAHGGRAPQVRAAAARRLALGEALDELRSLGRPIEIDPAEAMLEMVYEAAGNVAVYRALVRSLDTRIDHKPGHIQGKDEEVDDAWRDELGRGIAGRVDPSNWKAAPHIWVTLYDEERERLVRFCKLARDAGVDERRVQLAEAQGRRIGLVLQAGTSAAFALLVQLVAGGLALEAAVERVQRDEMPALLRAAIETTGTEEKS